MATLTGAHRVALGTDLPGVFTDDEQLAADIAEASAAAADYTWRALRTWRDFGVTQTEPPRSARPLSNLNGHRQSGMAVWHAGRCHINASGRAC